MPKINRRKCEIFTLRGRANYRRHDARLKKTAATNTALVGAAVE